MSNLQPFKDLAEKWRSENPREYTADGDRASTFKAALRVCAIELDAAIVMVEGQQASDTLPNGLHDSLIQLAAVMNHPALEWNDKRSMEAVLVDLATQRIVELIHITPPRVTTPNNAHEAGQPAPTLARWCECGHLEAAHDGSRCIGHYRECGCRKFVEAIAPPPSDGLREPGTNLARWIWNRFIGCPIEEPFTGEFRMLLLKIATYTDEIKQRESFAAPPQPTDREQLTPEILRWAMFGVHWHPERECSIISRYLTESRMRECDFDKMVEQINAALRAPAPEGKK